MQTNQLYRCLVVVAAIGLSGVFADDNKPAAKVAVKDSAKKDSAKDGEKDPAKAAHLERMRRIVQSVKVFEFLDGDKRIDAKLVDRPVLAYRDDTRKQQDSTMWIFGTEGRPSAMLAIEHYPNRQPGTQWLFELTSLAAGRVAADRGSELHWRARQPGLMLTALADAPAPSDRPAARLAQMRELRRRFTAHEREGTDGRIELQPLSAPLYRYEDPAEGILDGAVFAFANGTNPEVLWVIEVIKKPEGPATWQFGLAQMTGAAVFVALNEKEIWTRGEAYPPADRDSYVNGWMSAVEQTDSKSK